MRWRLLLVLLVLLLVLYMHRVHVPIRDPCLGSIYGLAHLQRQQPRVQSSSDAIIET